MSRGPAHPSWFLGIVRKREPISFEPRSLRSMGTHTTLVRADNAVLFTAPPGPTLQHSMDAAASHVTSGTVLDTDHASRAVLGQFASVTVEDNTFRLRTDPNGLRSIYVHDGPDALVFSTHLHLLALVTGGLRLNVDAFASHWLCHNGFTGESLAADTQRLHAGAGLDIDLRDSARAAAVAAPEPQPEPEPTSDLDDDRVFDVLSGKRLALALSGGLDSRFLLSILLRRRADVHPFVFGDEKDADVAAARMVCRRAGLPLTVIPNASLSHLLDTGYLDIFARDTFCISPITAAQHLCQYDRVLAALSPDVIVDGGFGEIGRGGYYRKLRLLLFADRLDMRGLLGKVLRPRNAEIDTYFHVLSTLRCQVFREDVARRMSHAARNQVERIAEELRQAPLSAGVDHLAARYRRANFYGHGQGWIDSFAPSYMPFAQNAYIGGALSRPFTARGGAYAHKARIYRNSPSLTRSPLAFGSGLAHFHVPFPVWTPGRALRKEPHASALSTPRMTEFLSDTYLADGADLHPLCDAGAVRQTIQSFLDAPTESQAIRVSWFLAFDRWTRMTGMGG